MELTKILHTLTLSTLKLSDSGKMDTERRRKRFNMAAETITIWICHCYGYFAITVPIHDGPGSCTRWTRFLYMRDPMQDGLGILC